VAERPERHAPLTGIAAVVLWFVSLVIVEGLTNPPSENATPERALAYFNDEEVGIFVSSFLFALGSLLFLWFVGSLRAALVAAERGVARVSNIAFAAGVAFSLLTLLFALAPSVGAFSNETLGPSAAEALWYLDDLFFVAAQFTAIPLLVATALVALRTGALPRWLAWLSLVVAAVLLFPLGGVFALGLGVPVWTVATSVVLSRRAGA
jgi:hypothetical protein